MGRPVTVSVGPLANASATKIAAAQKAAGAQALVLNGTATDAVANNICASQSPSGVGNLTINGSAAISGVAYIPATTARRVYITSAGNDSGVTFTVTGTRYAVSGPPVVVKETVTGANTSVVSTTATFNTVTQVAISGASAGAVTVGMNGVATLDVARRVLFTPAGNDASITYTITGTDQTGNAISETLAGVANPSTTYTVLDYLTITGITISGAAASTMTIGTNGIASSPWVRFDGLGSNAQVAIQCDVSGTVNATVQSTLDDPNVITNQLPTPTYLFAKSAVQWVNTNDPSAVNFTSNIQTNFVAPPIFARVLLNSGSGSVQSTFQQAYQD